MSSSAALKTEPVKAKRAASRASEAAPSQQPKLSVVAGIAPASSPGSNHDGYSRFSYRHWWSATD